jgi:hypothetical protein
MLSLHHRAMELDLGCADLESRLRKFGEEVETAEVNMSEPVLIQPDSTPANERVVLLCNKGTTKRWGCIKTACGVRT